MPQISAFTKLCLLPLHEWTALVNPQITQMFTMQDSFSFKVDVFCHSHGSLGSYKYSTLQHKWKELWMPSSRKIQPLKTRGREIWGSGGEKGKVQILQEGETA